MKDLLGFIYTRMERERERKKKEKITQEKKTREW